MSAAPGRENMLMVKDREILDLKGSIAEMLAVGSSNGISSIMNSLGVGSIGGDMSAAPGGFPATTRSSASSGLFTPYSHHSNTETHHHGGEIGVLDLPAGTELSKLAGLGLDTIESSTAVTSSLFTSTTYSTTNGFHSVPEIKF